MKRCLEAISVHGGGERRRDGRQVLLIQWFNWRCIWTASSGCSNGEVGVEGSGVGGRGTSR